MNTRRRMLAALAAAAFATALPAAAQEPIKIGLVTALSGQSARAGEAITRGLTLAIDEINAAGGLLGGRKLVLVRRDDEANPQKGVTAAQDLISKGAVVGLVTCDLYCDSTPWIVETDASGNELDTVHVNAVLFPSDGVLTADGGFAFARSADPPAGGLQDIQLVVTDPAGSPLVTKTYGRASTDEASGLDRTADGGFVIVGRSVDSGPSPRIYLIKADANGDAGPNPP